MFVPTWVLIGLIIWLGVTDTGHKIFREMGEVVIVVLLGAIWGAWWLISAPFKFIFAEQRWTIVNGEWVELRKSNERP